MSMQLFVPSFHVDECLEEIRECLIKGWTGLGYKTVQFEDAWKKYTGLPYAHFLNSATSGLHLAVRVLKDRCGWQEGDEIISTPLTFVSTNHAILYEHMNVVFADVDEYLCLDPVDVERKITNKSRAVVFVGMGGSTGHLEEIAKICRRHDLKLILDAAHMSGTRLYGKCPAEWADVAVFSYQAVKNLPTADAGMICFAKEEDDRICRELSWLGINKDTYSRSNDKSGYKWLYEVNHIGFKYHGNSIMAAIALVQLRYLDADNARRREIALYYDKRLQNIEGIKVVAIPDNCEPSRHLFIIETESRDKLFTYLNEHKIYPGVHYRDNIEYGLYSYAEGTCPNARRLSKRVISLPLHLTLSNDEAEYIASTVIEFTKKKD